MLMQITDLCLPLRTIELLVERKRLSNYKDMQVLIKINQL